jgi:hypothetical protein
VLHFVHVNDDLPEPADLGAVDTTTTASSMAKACDVASISVITVWVLLKRSFLTHHAHSHEQSARDRRNEQYGLKRGEQDTW